MASRAASANRRKRSDALPVHMGRSTMMARTHVAMGSASMRLRLFADGAHDARSRTTLGTRSPHLLEDYLVIGAERGDRKLRLHEHDLVAASLEVVEQIGYGLRRCMLEVVHQHDAFAVLLQLRHHRLSDLLGLAHLEVEGVHVGGKDRDIALAEIVDQLW